MKNLKWDTLWLYIEINFVWIKNVRSKTINFIENKTANIFYALKGQMIFTSLISSKGNENKKQDTRIILKKGLIGKGSKDRIKNQPTELDMAFACQISIKKLLSN